MTLSAGSLCTGYGGLDLAAHAVVTDLDLRWVSETDRDAGKRLNPAFVEWMMMLPPGWVTDIDISHTAKLRILGNGVVPPQAANAFLGLGVL